MTVAQLSLVIRRHLRSCLLSRLEAVPDAVYQREGVAPEGPG